MVGEWRKSVAAGKSAGQGRAGASEQKRAVQPACLDQTEGEGGRLSGDEVRGLGAMPHRALWGPRGLRLLLRGQSGAISRM